MRASIKTGVIFGAIALTWEALAVLPGRVTQGRHQAQYGRSPTEFAIAGMFRDLSDIALPLGLVIGLAIAIAMLMRKSRSEAVLRKTTLRTFAVVLGVIGVSVWLSSSAAAEFKIQRGVDATWFDVEIGSRSPSMGRTFLGFLFLRRHWIPAVWVASAAALFVAFVRRRSTAWTLGRPLPVLLGFGAMTLFGFGAALVPLDPHVRVFRTIGDRHIVGEPYVNLFSSLGRSQENVRLGMKGLIERAEFPPIQSRGGEALLGLPEISMASVDCRAHPMARNLPVAGVESPRPGALGHHPLEPPAARVLALLDQLSAELYTDRSAPIDVWQLMLESFRGDDIHAISPSAPRKVAPFVSSLYESAERGDGSVIAVHRMWQAGSRTSQGFSSYMCGMGMMPYGLSVTRDFGPIPMRCITDVLSDARFEPRFIFGSVPSFDDMDTFFRDHGVQEIIGRMQLPLTLPTSEGGVSDRAVMEAAAKHVAKLPADRSHYVLIMTSSNHVPYGRPEDVPAEVDARVDALVESEDFVGTPDDTKRLRTFAYADHAVSELFDHVGPNLDRTIFVLGADHATGDPFVWRPGPMWSRDAAHALIPFAIVLPDPLIASTAHPDRVRALVREVHAALDHQPWSQNDVPLFVLTLLSHAPGMQALPSEHRWHTLGGERTSPFFMPPRADVKVVGINCLAGFYGTDENDRTLLPPETASFVTSANDIYTSSPSLIPVAATFSRFLNGYATACPSSVHDVR
jgi:Sulfatase